MRRYRKFTLKKAQDQTMDMVARVAKILRAGWRLALVSTVAEPGMTA
ncbi:MAG: hypothetical protein MRJ92_01655 [Nitrospira sp.]|nr:hypothetical protein [Nitrospira sp.]